MVAVAKYTLRANSPAVLGYTAGLYYPPTINGMIDAGTSISANRDVFVPFLCRKSTTFDRIALYNTGAVTLNFRLGIYADNGGGCPGSLVVDGGELTTSGAAGDNAATISAALTAGSLYWLVLNAASAIAFTGISNPRPDLSMIADFFAPAGNAGVSGTMTFINTRSYAAFPSTATAPTTYSNEVTPFIRLRAS
jgi:hypothetical protein